jgi:hypothetical protein
MIKIQLESPFRGSERATPNDHVGYLQACIRDSITRGEAPFASHQMYTQALDDTIPEEREAGIRAGYEWMQHAEKVVFYEDLGWSPGMRQARLQAGALKKPVEFRRILNDQAP